MDISSSSQQIHQIIKPSFQTILQKLKSNSKTFQQPTPRIFHSAVYHKSCIFIYGGLSLKPTEQFQNQHLFIYRYDINKMQWKKLQTNFPNNLAMGTQNPLKNIYSHCCVVHNNQMYLFGGKSGKYGGCHNQLWAMNLQSYNWRKQDQKGIIPPKRQSASMVPVNKSSLFLYGGKYQDIILNDIHIYKIDTKQWYSVETNNAQFLMSKRIRPGVCAVNDIIYVFGGQRESSVSQINDNLDDLYQIKIIQKSTSVKPDIWVKKISTMLNPGKLIGPKLFNVGDKYLGLIGGQNNIQQKNNKIWLYDPIKVKWMFSNLKQYNHENLGIGFSAFFQYERLYINGGFKNDLTPQYNSYSVHIDINEIKTTTNQKQRIQNQRLCLLCDEQKNTLCRKKLDGFSLLQKSIKQITYPFNSFGLLVDCSNLLKASLINISFAFNGKQRFLIIDDDGSCQNIWGNQEEFLQDMIKFRTISEQEMEVQGDENLQALQENLDQNIEVEQSPRQKPKVTSLNSRQDASFLSSAKKEEDKEQQKRLKKKKQLAKKTKARLLRRRKQFSVNIKVGAMRLAKKMIYISRTQDGGKRVFFLQQIKIHSIIDEQQQSSHHQQNTSSDGQIRYQCHYYYVNQTSPQLINPSSSTSSHTKSHASSQLSKSYVQNQYKNYLKSIPQTTSSKNHLILIGLKDSYNQQNLRQPELKINTKLNDVYFGTSKMINKAQSLNISLPDCIDVSLKCYLSMLYLKGEYARITLSTTSEKVEDVSNAAYFQKIDSLVKSNTIMDLEAAFDLEQCKIVELYYYKNLHELNKKGSKLSQKKQQQLANRQGHTHGLINVFLNGILIYHRNRLITRYKYPLGTLLKYHQLRKIINKNYNPLKIFGFIELDQVFYSNIFKTKIVNEQNISNMEGRIKFVEKYLESKTKEKVPSFGTSGKRISSFRRDDDGQGDQGGQGKKRNKVDA